MTQFPTASDASLNHLLALARDLLQASDLKSVMELAGHATPELLQADGASLLVVMGGRAYHTEFDDHGVIQPAREDSALLQHARQALANQTPVIVSDVEVDCGLANGERSTVKEATLIAFPFPPIKPVGVLTAYWYRQRPQDKLTQEISTLRHLGKLTGAALGNAVFRQSLQREVAAQSQELAEAARQHADELLRRDGIEEEIQRISVTDVMTGMLNRRGFFLQAEQSLKVARRQGLPSAVIFADINGLKRVNDEFGHEAGDRLIEYAGQILQKSFRDSDIVARLGGDEFAAFALDSAQPHVILARIQRSIDHFSPRPLLPYRISFSTGIVKCNLMSDLSLSDYLSLADQEMYTQKKQRNRQVLARA